MKNHLLELQYRWDLPAAARYVKITDDDMLLFRSTKNLTIPADLAEYFKILNGADDEYDEKFFKFYSFEQFESVDTKFRNWGGAAEYRNIVNTLEKPETCFVFADYTLHLFSYAIRLYEDASKINEIYIICGDKHKIIAHSFHEFITIYLADSDLIYCKE